MTQSVLICCVSVVSDVCLWCQGHDPKCVDVMWCQGHDPKCVDVMCFCGVKGVTQSVLMCCVSMVSGA